MKHRTPAATTDKRKDRLVYVVVFLVVTWALLATTVAAVTAIHTSQASNNHHAETSAQNVALLHKDAQIQAAQKAGRNELTEIKALQTAQTMLQAELNADFNKAETALTTGQNNLVVALDAICVAVHAGCSSG